MVDDRGIEYVADNLGIGPENTKEQQTSPSPDAKTCKLALVSMVLGVSSIMSLYVMGIVAIVSGAIALIRIKSSNGLLYGNHMAITGIVAPIVYFLLVLALGYLWFKP